MCVKQEMALTFVAKVRAYFIAEEVSKTNR